MALSLNGNLVSPLTLGTGQISVREFGTTDAFKQIGFNKGATLEFNQESADFESLRPLQLITQVKLREGARIITTAAQATVDNLIIAIGGGTNKTSGYTFEVSSWNPEQIQLKDATPVVLSKKTAGHDIVGGVESPEVRSDDGSILYFDTVDYNFVQAAGTIEIIVPNAGIASGDLVNVNYKFTDSTAEVMSFGGSPLIDLFEVKVSDISPAGFYREATIYKASTLGSVVIAYNETEFSTYEITFNGLAVPTRAQKDRYCRYVTETGFAT